MGQPRRKSGTSSFAKPIDPRATSLPASRPTRAARVLMLWAATCLLEACLYPEYVETDSLSQKKSATSVNGGAEGTVSSHGAPRGGSSAAQSAEATGGHPGSTLSRGGADANAGGDPAVQGGSSATSASGGLSHTVVGGTGGSGSMPSPSGGIGTGGSRASGEMGGGRLGGGAAGTLNSMGASAGIGAVVPVCGNQRREGNEACDDGNRVAGDGCNPDCSSTETCGNGIPDAAKGEECDLGTCASTTSAPGTCNHDNGTCTTNCKLARCGDGKVRTIVAADGGPPESCDLGLVNVAPAKAYGAGVCTTACQTAPQCGDSTVDQSFGEICDDGNAVNSDGCSSLCKNGLNRPCTSASDCAESLLCDLSSGQNRCEKERTCGNGKLEKGEREACDDGNTANADGCSSDCLIEVGAATECSANSQCAAGSCLLPVGGVTTVRRCLIPNGDGPCTANDQCEGGLCANDKCTLGTRPT